VLDSKDDFEDGVYELVLGAQVFALIKSGREYDEITSIRLKAAIPVSYLGEEPLSLIDSRQLRGYRK